MIHAYYTETNSYTINDDSLKGTTWRYSVNAFADTFEGETDQEKIDNAFKNGTPSQTSKYVEVTFPGDKPEAPTNLKADNITDTSADLSWSSPAQSFVINKQVVNDAKTKRKLVDDGPIINAYYSEETKYSIEDETLPGTKMNYSVMAFPKKFTGSTEQDKIDNALDSGLASPSSDPIQVQYLPTRPKTPTAVKSANLTSTAVDLSWTAGSSDGKSWVIHHSTNDSEPIYMHYTEEPKFNLNDDNFKGTLAGNKLVFFIQEFNETFTGKDEIEQAKNANETGYGSEWSSPGLEVEFPLSV